MPSNCQQRGVVAIARVYTHARLACLVECRMLLLLLLLLLRRRVVGPYQALGLELRAKCGGASRASGRHMPFAHPPLFPLLTVRVLE